MPLIRKHKVCAECGKSESVHWARHWSRHHPDKQKKALAPGESPSNPYEESWMYLIEPLSLREQFLWAAPLARPQPNNTSVTLKDEETIASTEPASLDPAPEFIEIDDASSDSEQPEEVKEESAQQTIEGDLESLSTQKLFNLAGKILHIIMDRLRAREVKARDELRAGLRQPKTIVQYHAVPLYATPGSCHLSMSRSINPQSSPAPRNNIGILGT